MPDALHFVSNRILAALPQEEYLSLSRHLSAVSLPAGRVLCETDAPIRNAYFITAGLACTVTTTKNGLTVASLLKGCEGFVEVPIILDCYSNPVARTLMVVSGSALRIEARLLQERLKGPGILGTILKRYVMAQIVQLMQAAACGRLHSTKERLACWLLMTHDRVGSPFIMTHETMARMLGSRRATVSMEAEKIQRAGIIKYVHGRVHILSRLRLEDIACECYAVQHQQMSNILQKKSFSLASLSSEG